MKKIVGIALITVLGVTITGCTTKQSDLPKNFYKPTPFPFDSVQTYKKKKKELIQTVKMEPVIGGVLPNAKVMKTTPQSDMYWYEVDTLASEYAGAFCMPGQYKMLENYDDLYTFTRTDVEAQSGLSGLAIDIFLESTWKPSLSEDITPYLEYKRKINRTRHSIAKIMNKTLPASERVREDGGGNSSIYICTRENDTAERDPENFANNVSYGYTAMYSVTGKTRYLVELSSEFFSDLTKAHYKTAVKKAKNNADSLERGLKVIDALSDQQKEELRNALKNI